VQFSVDFQGGAGEAAAFVFVVHIREQSRFRLAPMDQVFGSRMAPVHGAPVGRVGIVLEKGVVPAPEVAQAVGVVHPALFRLKMTVKPDVHGNTSLFTDQWHDTLRMGGSNGTAIAYCRKLIGSIYIRLFSQASLKAFVQYFLGKIITCLQPGTVKTGSRLPHSFPLGNNFL